jgi:Cu2+-exporting ATPase
MFRNRFWWSLLLSVPVVFTSHMIAGWFGYHVPDGLTWVPPILGAVVFLYGGWPFLAGAPDELRARRPGMMTLVAMAITVAFGSSMLATFGVVGTELDFWWELVLLVVVMLLGHWLEMRALGQASGALEALAALLPDRAERVGPDGGIEEVSVAELRTGDTVLVRSGGRVPADGTVVRGSAAVDESMITGESRTVSRSEGDRVVAGTVATDSSVRVRVDAIGDDTTLAGIQRLVSEAQESKSRSQTLADRAAALLFWFALTAAVITAVVWGLLLGDGSQAVERTVTVLVIACPHALGLAIPLVIAISTTLSARNGILVKDRLALERTRLVDTVLFDKTGTLTKGAPAVTGTAAAEDRSVESVLALAGAVESDSEHPLAKAIVRAAAESGPVPAATDFRSLTGHGVQATVDGTAVYVGGPALLNSLGVTEPADLTRSTGPWRDQGATVLHVVADGAVIGALALADEVRPESASAVRQLQAQGVRVAMVTGDARNVADTTWQENFQLGEFEARGGWQTCGSVNEPWFSLDTLSNRWYKPVGERSDFKLGPGAKFAFQFPALAGYAGWTLQNNLWGWGGGWSKEESFDITCNSAESVEALSFLKDWVYKDKVAGVAGVDQIQDFAAGVASATVGSTGDLITAITSAKFDVGVAPLPAGPSGEAYTFVGGSNLMMFENAENKDAAWRLMQYLSEDDTQTAYADLMGMFPARLDPQEQAAEKDANYAAFYEAIQDGRTYAPIPQWGQVETAYQEHFGNILDMAAGAGKQDYSSQAVAEQLQEAKKVADGHLAQSTG